MVLICFFSFFLKIYLRICRPDLCNNNGFRVPPTDRFQYCFWFFVCMFVFFSYNHLFISTSRPSFLRLFYAVSLDQQALKAWHLSILSFYCCDLILSNVKPGDEKNLKGGKKPKSLQAVSFFVVCPLPPPLLFRKSALKQAWYPNLYHISRAQSLRWLTFRLNSSERGYFVSTTTNNTVVYTK